MNIVQQFSIFSLTLFVVLDMCKTFENYIESEIQKFTKLGFLH